MRRAAMLSSAKGKGKSSSWMKRHVNDTFVQNAKKEGLRSRSAFKLDEVLKIIKPHHIVCDLGAAPGGWSVSVAKVLARNKNSSDDSGDKGVRDRNGRLFAIDLLPMDPIDKCEFIQGDFLSEEVRQVLAEKVGAAGVDCVLSDMLHNMTGHKQTDHFKSMDLVHTVLDFSNRHLKPGPGSSMFVKFLRGEDENEFLAELREEFDSVKVIKPAASRKDSSEMYVLARGKKR